MSSILTSLYDCLFLQNEKEELIRMIDDAHEEIEQITKMLEIIKNISKKSNKINANEIFDRLDANLLLITSDFQQIKDMTNEQLKIKCQIEI